MLDKTLHVLQKESISELNYVYDLLPYFKTKNRWHMFLQYVTPE
jgi:hypothetical protein